MSVVTVGNTSGLLAALKMAQAGDTIQLAPGTYTTLTVRDLQFDGNVTITSQNPNNQAVITGITLDGAKGLVFKDLDFNATGTTKQFGPFEVFDSKNITFQNLNVHGSLDGDASNDNDGFRITGGSNITIKDSEFQQFRYSLGHKDVDGLNITGNYFHDIRSDGVRGSGSSNVDISKNHFENFYRVEGDHADAIQFFAGSTVNSPTNIKITDNVIIQSGGQVMQGIFLSDESDTHPFINVKISGNMIVGGNYNAISVSNGRNVEVSDNTLVQTTDTKIRISLKAVDGAVVKNNDAPSIIYNTVTNLTQTANDITARVSDGGDAAFVKWAASNMDIVNLHDELRAVLGSPPITQPDQPSSGPRPGEPVVVTPPVIVTPPPVVTPPVTTPPVTTPPVTTPPVTTPVQQEPESSGAPNFALKGASISSAETSILNATTYNLTLTGSKAIDAIGNVLDNVILGNSGKNQIAGGAGHDSISGGGGNDYLRGDAGNDMLSGDAGDDELHGNAGNDSLWGGDGKDNLFGEEGNDMIYGDLGDDKINGNAGNDTIWGGDGNDQLLGGQDVDHLYGGAGNDILSGDAGNDVLWGGAGADTFNMAKGFGVDRVMDFSLSDGDRVKLASGVSYTVSHVGSDTVVSLSTGDQMVLVGVDISASKAEWILGG